MIAEIQAAFDAQIQTVWKGPIAYEGDQYDVSSGVPYLDCRMAAQNQIQAGLGIGVPVRWSGSYQIVVYRPFGEGTSEAIAWAEKIRKTFPRGLQLPLAPTGAIVLNTMISQPDSGGTYISVPVIVFWFATEIPS